MNVLETKKNTVTDILVFHKENTGDMAKQKEYKVIHMHIFDSAKSIFNNMKNQKASCHTIECCIKKEKCDLHKKGQCVYRQVLRGGCPYGKRLEEHGFTRRAQKYGQWIRDKKEQYKDVGSLDAPESDKMCFIGDYVYLPYSHITMNTAVPFKTHSHVFVRGNSFLKKEDWTPETIESIVNFRPMAMMGVEITRYQKEVVPTFLLQLREEDPDMYQQLIKIRPDLGKDIDHVGRKSMRQK